MISSTCIISNELLKACQTSVLSAIEISGNTSPMNSAKNPFPAHFGDWWVKIFGNPVCSNYATRSKSTLITRNLISSLGTRKVASRYTIEIIQQSITSRKVFDIVRLRPASKSCHQKLRNELNVLIASVKQSVTNQYCKTIQHYRGFLFNKSSAKSDL